MWFSDLVEFLKSSRPLSLSPRVPARRPGWFRPLVVEPLEDRLVLTGKVDMDVAPGTKSRPQPPMILTFVMNVPVNWFDLGWLGGNGGKKTKPAAGPNGSGTNQNGSAPRNDMGPSVEGLAELGGLDSAGVPSGIDGPPTLMLAGGPSVTTRAPVTVGSPAGSVSATPSLPSTKPPPLPAPDQGASNAGLVTPAQSDSFFQQTLSAGAF